MPGFAERSELDPVEVAVAHFLGLELVPTDSMVRAYFEAEELEDARAGVRPNGEGS